MQTEQLAELVKTKGAQAVISFGLNMECEKIITKSLLYFEDGRFCLKNDGVNMYCDDLSDLLLDTKENRHKLSMMLKEEKGSIEIGDIVRVQNVRSNHLDNEKGIGWTASEVDVVVDGVNDLTFCFWFNDDYHYELISNCKPSPARKSYNEEKELAKIKYTKDSIDYRLKTEYGV